MINLLKRIAYQPEKPTMLGPYWSAIGHGYLRFCPDGYIRITSAGEQAVAETHSSDSSESTPPAVFSDPTSQPPESGER